MDNDEEIMMDITTCAMTFRLLRMNGYVISSGKRGTRLACQRSCLLICFYLNHYHVTN